MARYFITGGSGFVGRNLIRALKARGDEVVALARSPRACLIVEELGALAAHGDLEDADAMSEGMTGCDCVIHAAALAAEWGEADRFYRFNVDGTNNVILSAIQAGVKTLVHISTEAVLADGGPMKQLNEQSPLPHAPLPRYPETKARAESAVLAANSASLRTVVVRPRMIWGKDDSTLLPEFAQAVLTGRFMWIDEGHYLTSTTHIDNVVEGVLLAAEKGAGGEVYFLTDGQPLEFRSFLTSLLVTQGVTPPNKSLPRWLAWRLAQACERIWDFFGIKRPPPVTRFVVAVLGQEVTIDDSKARQDLGYTGAVSWKDGLAELTQRSNEAT